MSDFPSAVEFPWKRQRLRVPRDDESSFASPSIRQAVGLAQQNHEQLEAANIDIQGRTLEKLRRWTRERAYEAARQYTSELIQETIPIRSFNVLVVAGHQPSLFHPGVWIKNFALDHLADRTEGVGLNLVVDNDTFSSVSIRVPRGDHTSPSIERIAFDSNRPQQPWENAEILDENTFRAFGGRIASVMAQWGITPIVTQLWPAAVDTLSQSRHLRDCLTAARNRLERSWGLSNLELPISQLCNLDPFLWFASHLLAHLDRFHQIHNQVLREYKQVNRIRSRTAHWAAVRWACWKRLVVMK